jgi:hypothetical protein
MSRWKYFFLIAPALLFLGCAGPGPQVGVGLQYGPEPGCPYGYFDYSPYDCAPYGYYGPEWFNGGVFIGAGPWYHGPRRFRGHVDNHYDPHHGYHGEMPKRGEKATPEHRAGHVENFHGNEVRNGRGNSKQDRH